MELFREGTKGSFSSKFKNPIFWSVSEKIVLLIVWLPFSEILPHVGHSKEFSSSKSKNPIFRPVSRKSLFSQVYRHSPKYFFRTLKKFSNDTYPKIRFFNAARKNRSIDNFTTVNWCPFFREQSPFKIRRTRRKTKIPRWRHGSYTLALRRDVKFVRRMSVYWD